MQRKDIKILLLQIRDDQKVRREELESFAKYSQLKIEQGTGDYVNHIVVKKRDTGEFLVIIQNTSLSSISNADFSAI